MMTASVTRSARNALANGRVPLIIVVGLGLGLRFFNLNTQSYWYDEAFSWDKSSRPFGEMIAALIADFAHPPLHYIILHFWLHMIDWSDQAAAGRFLACLFGVAGLPAIFWLAREIYDWRTALLAVALLSVSQLGIAYSQEVRPYSQLVLFTTLAIACYVRSVRCQSLPAFAGTAIFTACALATHYYAVFVVAALIAWHLVYARSRLPTLWILCAAGFVVASGLPWLLSGVVHEALSAPQRVHGAQPSYFSVTWGTPLENLAAFGNARSLVVGRAQSPWRIIISVLLYCVPIMLMLRGLAPVLRWRLPVLPTVAVFGWPIAVAVAAVGAQLLRAPISVCFLIGVLGAVSLARCLLPVAADEAPYAVLLSALIAVPIAILCTAGKFGVQYDVRYVLPAITPFYVLAARAVMQIGQPVLRSAWIVAMVAYSFVGALIALTIPYKEDYRQAMAAIHAAVRPGDCVAFAPKYTLPAQWSLYRYDDVPIRLIERKELLVGAPGCRSVWLSVVARVPWAIEQARTDAAVLAKSRHRVLMKKFFWVELVEFGPMSDRFASLHPAAPPR